MATISRKFQDFRKNIGVVQTTHNWIVEVSVEKGKVSKLKDSAIEFRTEALEGCPPTPDPEAVTVNVGGFTFNYYGKTAKNGEIAFSAYEDVTGKVGALAREINRIWGKGVSASGKVNDATMIGDSGYFKADQDVRFKIVVKLADNAGNVTKQWIFYDAIGKAVPEGELSQESGAFKYRFTFLYSMFEEGMGAGQDTW
jgi:hypothetical protein